MAGETTTPNMGLFSPGVGTTVSPTWASDLNANNDTVDQHDHTSGKGVAITPSGLNINADLLFGGNNATQLRSSRYSIQVSALLGASDLACSYAAGASGDLYWNDGVGNQIQITASGGIAGTPGSISNLVAPAAATWVGASSTFVWTRSAGVGANMDAATLILRYPGSYPTPSGNYIAIQAPSSLATGYALTLPAALPGATSIAQIDSSGNLSAALVVDNSTLQIATNILSVKNLGIGTAQLADASVTKAKLAALGQQISSSSGAAQQGSNTSYVDVSNLTVTITTIGRPIFISLMPDGDVNIGNNAFLGSINASGTALFAVNRGGAVLAQWGFGSSVIAPPSSCFFLDIPVAGTYTYKIQALAANGSAIWKIQYTKLVVYEL